MTNNLTEGQRIDVYEVVADMSNDYPLVNVGDHYNGKVDLSGNIDTYHPKASPEKSSKGWIYLYKSEVRKCGYYLKVKSLKGGNK